MKTQDVNFIHPEDTSNVNYWSRKWGVSNRQLSDAILYTGSLNTTRVKDYLRKNTAANAPLALLWNTLKRKLKFTS